MKEKPLIKLKRILCAVKDYLPSFGIHVFCGQVYTIIADNSEKSRRYKDKYILEYLKKNYAHLITKYSDVNEENTKGLINNSDSTNTNIWVCWWQGIDSMPEIVKLCYDSQMRCSNGHSIILLTKDNIKDYVGLPAYIWEQFESGKLRIQHLADIIRVTLIKNYGGLWLDASIFCKEQIPVSCFEYPFFSLRSPYIQGRSDYNVSLNRWTTFLIGGQKNNLLCSFLYDFFLEYCKKEKFFIDYFLFDCAIALTYENIPGIKGMIDVLPLLNGDYNILSEMLEAEADEKLLKKVKNECAVFNKIKWGRDVSAFPENSLYYYLKDEKTH